MPTAILRIAIDERHNEQEQRDQIECHDAKHFTVEPQNLCWYPLQRLKHEEEIPFRLDACRRRRKGVCFLSQLPREQSSQRSQYSYRQNPSDQIAHHEV